jgi:hypothetical protein
MKLKKKRGAVSEVNLSFLDVISCGFGAIVLLLIIAKNVDPGAMEAAEDLDAAFKDMQQQVFEIRGETDILNRQLQSKQEQVSELTERIARLQEKLASIERQRDANAQVDTTERDELTLALQILTEEMERLLGKDHRSQNLMMGGIPVDSEYIIFIIDTSGSMFNYAWPRVRKEMINILNIYPKVKGIQVMNDMGEYMFSSYRGKWIPDTPSRRNAVIKRLNTWTPFSNSSPVEGINRAIRAFYDPKKKISLYVFGDDFQGRSIRKVVTTVDKLNKTRRSGERLVRIHCVGFPVHFLLLPQNQQQTASRFAALMREMSYRNGGTFIGLNGLK